MFIGVVKSLTCILAVVKSLILSVRTTLWHLFAFTVVKPLAFFRSGQVFGTYFCNDLVSIIFVVCAQEFDSRCTQVFDMFTVAKSVILSVRTTL